jgi:hypothetical protein
VIGAESTLHGDDRAEMCVTIHRTEGRTTLEARWAEETKVTRHFCVTPKDPANDRMGLEQEEAAQRDCYARAIDAITGTKVSDPGLGYEWRLMPVAESQEEPEGCQKHGWGTESEFWHPSRASGKRRRVQVVEPYDLSVVGGCHG